MKLRTLSYFRFFDKSKLALHLGYVQNLVGFAFQENPLLYLSLLITILSASIELLAMSSLFPLFELVSGSRPSSDSLISMMLIFIGVKLTANTYFSTFILLLTIRIVSQLFAQTLSQYLGRQVMAQLSTKAFSEIIKTIPIGDIGERSIGYFISLAGDETFRASTLIISIIQFVGTAFLGILYFSYIVKFSFITGALVLLFMFCSMFALTGVLKYSHRLGGKQIDQSRRENSIFLDSLNNMKTIRALSAEEYVSKMYNKAKFNYAKTLFLIDEMALLSKMIPILIMLGAVGLWLIFAHTSIETVGIAFVVTISVYLMRFFPVVGQGVNLLMKIISDAKSGKDVTKLIADNSLETVSFQNLHGEINHVQLDAVSFYYGDKAEKPVINSINFSLHKTNSYALVGKSGVGKSTLIDLLLRFYLPTSGSMSINGISAATLSAADIRQKVILVSQEAAIFDDTVMNNICMGKSAIADEVRRACEIACIDKVIESMEQGYETRLQYQGKNMSGGQRQRIAIARAILRKPDVLILDESTSALDKLTQTHVIENILREYKDKIIVFVTHDPQIMSLVDEVIDLTIINHI